MIAASWPRGRAGHERLLHVDPRTGEIEDYRVSDLPRLLRKGDLLVVNDAATLPASMEATSDCNHRFEVRLLRGARQSTWIGVLFGPGDWRTDTALRLAPPSLEVGAILTLAGGALRARVKRRCGPRRVELEMDASPRDVLAAIYTHGRPVQYAYLSDTLDLESVQTPFAGRPWAAEMPSAGRALHWGVLLEALRRGVECAAVTLAAGLSSIGAGKLDAALPLSELFEVPKRTVAAVQATRANGGRVVAIGTTVVRALEGCARLHAGELASGQGETDVVLGRNSAPSIVDGILTNMHEPGESHFELLHAFAPADVLDRAIRHAEAEHYLAHEFGDCCLILAAATGD